MPLDRRAPLALASLLSSLALAPHAVAQAVWSVDDDAPADFSTVQAAVDAAADGDLVLIRPGLYLGAKIDGKALTLQVDGPPGSAKIDAVVAVFGMSRPALEVANLAVGESVVVRGLHLWALGGSSTQRALLARTSAGPIVVEECLLENWNGTPVTLDGCGSVTFADSTLDAGDSLYDSFQDVYLSEPALVATGSSAWIYDGVLLGSVGPDGAHDAHAGPGAWLAGSSLFAQGCTITGGDGGDATTALCAAGGDGASGVRYDAGSLVRLRDTVVTAGVGGASTPGCGLPDGADGVIFDGPAGGVVTLAGAARSLAIASPVAPGGSADVTLAGEPGDLAALVLGVAPSPATFVAAYAAVQHVAPPFVLAPLGPVDAQGGLALQVVVPPLAPGVAFVGLHAQALFVTSSLGVAHSGPAVLVIR